MRVLLKLSGEALGSAGKVFDEDVLGSIAAQIKKMVKDGIGVGIVCGGGNMVRGKAFEKLGFERVAADHMGMLGTTMNCMALCAALNKAKVKAIVMSATKVDGVEDIDVARANELISDNYVVLFGGGIGNPYFTTDTACALRAIEIKADKILMAKNGVDGVYSDDPSKNPEAKFIKNLTFDDILDMKLNVMDATAASLCRDNGIDAFVFNMSGKDNIYKASIGKLIGTKVKA